MKTRYGAPAYPYPDREPDFTLIREEEDRKSKVSYWVIEVMNISNFKILYKYHTGYFDKYLASIEMKAGSAVYRFQEDLESIQLNTDHALDLQKRIKLYIDEKFEDEVLRG